MCATARFWKPAHHVFCFSKTELTPTLEEVRRICNFSTLMGPAMFMRRTGYVAVLRELTGLSAQSYVKRLVCVDGPVPALHLNYFEEVSKKRAALGDELWLRSFVTCFLVELIFSHGWMTVAIEVVEIALTVVTHQIDLAPVVLAETYRGLDRI